MMDVFFTYLEFIEKISIVGGIGYAVYTLWVKNCMAVIANDNLQLNSWDKLKVIIDKDTEIRGSIFKFLENYEESESLTIEVLKKKYKTGKMIYLSPELDNFNKIGRHYESLGATIRLKYLPIKLLNEVIPFPDEFWDRTEQLRNEIKNNWFEKDSPLGGVNN